MASPGRSLRAPVIATGIVVAASDLAVSLYSGVSPGHAVGYSVLNGALTGLLVYRIFTLGDRLHRPRGLQRR